MYPCSTIAGDLRSHRSLTALHLSADRVLEGARTKHAAVCKVACWQAVFKLRNGPLARMATKNRRKLILLCRYSSNTHPRTHTPAHPHTAAPMRLTPSSTACRTCCGDFKTRRSHRRLLQPRRSHPPRPPRTIQGSRYGDCEPIPAPTTDMHPAVDHVIDRITEAVHPSQHTFRT